MKPTQFAALAVAAVLSVVVAIMAYTSSRPWSTSGEGTSVLMLPALQSGSAKISAIEIAQGKDKVRLAEKDGKWLIESGDSYPADTDAVRKLIVAAGEARLTERKTAKKELLKMLGLADPDTGNSPGRLIRFLDEKGGAIAEIIAGNKRQDSSRPAAGATYVRRPGDDQSWLADRAIEATTSFRDWTKTKLIDWNTESIKSASIEVQGESPYAIERESDGKSHKLASMPAGKKLKLVNSIDDIIEAVSLIEFKGVRKAGKAPLPAKAGRVILDRDKGEKVTVDYYSDGKQAWVTMSPEGTGDGKKASDELSGRTTGWEFEVPLAEITATFKKLSELLEDAGS